MRNSAFIILIIVLLTLMFVFVGCETQPEYKLVSINIDKGSFSDKYYIGDIIDYDNANLTLSYSDSTTGNIKITQSMVSDFSTEKEGVYTLKVRFEGFEVTHIYTVAKKIDVVTVSEVIPTGFKTEYLRNESIVLKGAMLTIVYSNGKEEVITDTEQMTVSGFNTKTLTANNLRSMSITVNTVNGVASCEILYSVAAPPTIVSFEVLNDVSLIFQENDDISVLTQRLRNYQYRVTYADGDVVELDYDANKMLVSSFFTDTAGTRQLTLQYTDSLDRKGSTKLEYEVIEKVQEYSVTYDYKGSADNTTASTIYGKVPRPNVAERLGYDFKGWYEEKYYNTNINMKWDFNAVIDQDITLHAWWVAIEYTIEYINAGDNSQNIANYNKYSITTKTFELYNETRIGYIFAGYFDGDTRVDSITIGTTGNLVLTAEWIPVEYSITYNYEEGTPPNEGNPSTYNIEQAIVFAEPTRNGYSFVGWKKDTTSEPVTGIKEGSTGAIAITAEWDIISYSITYILDEGESIQNPRPQYTIINETFTLPTPEKTGYTFAGWYLDEELTIEQRKSDGNYVIRKGSYGDIILYPKFIVNYQIVFQVLGGEMLEDLYFAENTTVVNLPNTNRNGYTFNGWKSVDGTIFEYGLTDTASLKDCIDYGISLILHAQWEAVVYTIEYRSADGLVLYDNDTYTVEDAKTLLNPAEYLEVGQIYRGWAEEINEQSENRIWNAIPSGVYRNLILYVILD